MYKKGTGNDKQGKDAGNRTLCPYRNFSQAISVRINSESESDFGKISDALTESMHSKSLLDRGIMPDYKDY